jgi:hypothetical protein
MAGWDKIRAAAQRPDCIFSAFPDGEAGAMYHPRSSAEEIFDLSGTLIEDGTFANAPTSVTPANANFNINNVTGDITFGARFFVKRINSVLNAIYFAPINFSRITSNRNGLCAQNTKITDIDCVFNASIIWKVRAVDGTEVNKWCSTGDFTVTTGEWHTFFLVFEATKGMYGDLNAYLDNVKIYSRKIGAVLGGGNWYDATLLHASSHDTVYVNDTNYGSKNHLCRTAWAMYFNRALSAEEIKYLSED